MYSLMIECYFSSTGVVITADSSKHPYFFYFVPVLHQRMFLNRSVESVCPVVEVHKDDVHEDDVHVDY